MNWGLFVQMLDLLPTDLLVLLSKRLRLSEAVGLRQVCRSMKERLAVQRILASRPEFERLIGSEYVWYEDNSYGRYYSNRKLLCCD